MKEREVTDQEGTSWSCVQAYSGGNGDNSKKIAKLTEGDAIPVVCTPSGGAQSVRLKLQPDWMEKLSDEKLLEAIQADPSYKRAS